MKKSRDKFYKYIIEEKMVKAGDWICVGLSGGADSICLLQLLYEERENLQIKLSAFHVNHCLRGEESETDQHFAERFCEERNIPLKIFRINIKEMAEKEKRGTEETGRIARRRAAEQCIKEGMGNKIALAHHLNDRAETLLFNMARGSSVSGLKGILPVNGNVIRPLLCMSKKEIEGELQKRNIKWRVDSSNLSDAYSRNRLRNKILPYFTEYINPESTRHIANAAEDLQEADEILREIAEKREEVLLQKKEQSIFIKEEILNEKRLLAGYILMDAMKQLTGTAVDLTRGHTRDILELMKKQSGRVLNLPYEIVAKKQYGGVLLQVEKKEKKETEEKILPLKEGIWKFEGRELRIEKRERVQSEEIPKKLYTKWFDYDKLSRYSCFRYRRSGDYLIVDAKGHKKKLKQYFIDEKIPAQDREKVLCLADGNRIIWVLGRRISEDCKVTEKTKNILKISVKGDFIGEKI